MGLGSTCFSLFCYCGEKYKYSNIFNIKAMKIWHFLVMMIFICRECFKEDKVSGFPDMSKKMASISSIYVSHDCSRRTLRMRKVTVSLM